MKIDNLDNQFSIVLVESRIFHDKINGILSIYLHRHQTRYHSERSSIEDIAANSIASFYRHNRFDLNYFYHWI